MCSAVPRRAHIPPAPGPPRQARAPSRRAGVAGSAHQLHLDEHQLAVAAIEYVVLDAGRPEIGDAAFEIREQLLAGFQDSHPAVGYRNDHVVVLVTMHPGMGARRQTVPGYSGPRVVDLTICFFEHGRLRRLVRKSSRAREPVRKSLARPTRRYRI